MAGKMAQRGKAFAAHSLATWIQFSESTEHKPTNQQNVTMLHICNLAVVQECEGHLGWNAKCRKKKTKTKNQDPPQQSAQKGI